MNKVGIITTGQSLNIHHTVHPIQKFMSQRLWNKFIPRIYEVGYTKMQIFKEEITLYVASLPFSQHELETVAPEILLKCCNEALDWFEEEGVARIISSQGVEKQHIINQRIQQEKKVAMSDGRALAVSLIGDVYRRACKKSGWDMNCVTVGIVEKHISDKSLYIMRQLMHHTKDIIFVTEKTEEVKEMAEDIFEDTGLVVWITNNMRSSLIAVDTIFVMDELDDFLRKARISNEAIIFSLGSRGAAGLNVRNKLIERIAISIPEENREALRLLNVEERLDVLETLIFPTSRSMLESLRAEEYEALRKTFYHLGCVLKETW